MQEEFGPEAEDGCPNFIKEFGSLSRQIDVISVIFSFWKLLAFPANLGKYYFLLGSLRWLKMKLDIVFNDNFRRRDTEIKVCKFRRCQSNIF